MSVQRSRAGYVVGFNPMPSANAVAMLGSRLRSSLLMFLVGAALWTGLWWWQREQWGNPWVLVAGYAVSLVLLLVTALRLAGARRRLGRIGSGPALEAGREGLVLHSLDGGTTQVAWHQVRAIRTSGRKLGAGPHIAVETDQGRVWSVPLSFLDALPGTIDGGLRAMSNGRHGLDLRSLDAIV